MSSASARGLVTLRSSGPLCPLDTQGSSHGGLDPTEGTASISRTVAKGAEPDGVHVVSLDIRGPTGRRLLDLIQPAPRRVRGLRRCCPRLADIRDHHPTSLNLRAAVD
jgi:hypothetical protein